MRGIDTSKTGYLLASVIVAVVVPALRAQESQPATPQIPTVAYVDKAFGFELHVPAGWNYDRTGFFGPGGSLGLLRGASPDGRASLQILAFRELRLASFPDWINFFGKQLGSLSGVERVRVKGDMTSPRPGAFVIAEAQVGTDRTRTVYYCVQFDVDTICVFSIATALGAAAADDAQGPGSDDAQDVQIPAEFTRLTDTLRVFYNPQLARELAAALKLGKDYLTRHQLQDDARKLGIDGSTRYYEIRVAGTPIGYLTRQFTYENEPLQQSGRISNAKEGLRVRERSYRFADDGTVHFSKIDLFSSRDGETDLYELWQASIAPPGATTPDPLITRDQCVREGDALFSTYTTSRDRGLPAPRRPIKLESTYLGLAWVRLLPALFGVGSQPMHAFTIYDPETRTLITHAITPLGDRPLPAESGRKAHAFETRAGLAEQPGLVFVGADGNMLRVEVGDLVLRLSDQATIEQQFGRQRDAATLRLAQRQGAP